MTPKIHERAARPSNCYIELLVIFCDHLFNRIVDIKPPNMDVLEIDPLLSEPSRYVLSSMLRQVTRAGRTAKYARLILMGTGGEEVLTESIGYIRSLDPHLIDEWRVYVTQVKDPSLSNQSIFEALGYVMPCGLSPVP